MCKIRDTIDLMSKHDELEESVRSFYIEKVREGWLFSDADILACHMGLVSKRQSNQLVSEFVMNYL